MNLDDVVRTAIRDVMREVIEPLIPTEAFQRRLAEVIAERSAQHRIVPAEPVPAPSFPSPAMRQGEPQAVAATAQPPAPRPAANLRGYRLSDAAVERARAAYFDAGGSLAKAAVKASMPKTTISTLAGRLGWREMLLGAAAKTVVPAETKPAPRQPVASSLVPGQLARSLAGSAKAAQLPRDPATGLTMPTEAAPMDPAQLEPVPASYEDVLDWLFAELRRQNMAPAEIEARFAAMSTKQLLATCNAQRVKAGLSPYVLTERAA